MCVLVNLLCGSRMGVVAFHGKPQTAAPLSPRAAALDHLVSMVYATNVIALGKMLKLTEGGNHKEKAEKGAELSSRMLHCVYTIETCLKDSQKIR